MVLYSVYCTSTSKTICFSCTIADGGYYENHIKAQCRLYGVKGGGRVGGEGVYGVEDDLIVVRVGGEGGYGVEDYLIVVSVVMVLAGPPVFG